MSRTYRRKSGDQTDLQWLTKTMVKIRGVNYWRWIWIPMEPGSDEYIKQVARYHSDAYFSHKEPGPSWFRNVFTERPQRRKAKAEIKKYMMDPDYEVILSPKDPLEYWT